MSEKRREWQPVGAVIEERARRWNESVAREQPVLEVGAYAKPLHQPLLSGLRCPCCGEFTAVPVGAPIPLCCWIGEYNPVLPAQKLPCIEHHLISCLHACDQGCVCPCHAYRPRDDSRQNLYCEKCGMSRSSECDTLGH